MLCNLWLGMNSVLQEWKVAYDILIFRKDFRENMETTDQSVQHMAHHHIEGRDGNCKSGSALKMPATSANIDKEELAYRDSV